MKTTQFVFVNAVRTSPVTVKATYEFDGTQFSVYWSCLDNNGDITNDYDIQANVDCSDYELDRRVSDAIREGETDDNPDLDLYLTVRDTFDGTDAQYLDHTVEINGVTNYEIGNGHEVSCVVDGTPYVVYLQLPKTGDSQESVLTGPGELPKEAYDAIYNEVESEYTSLELNAMLYGFTDDQCSHVTHDGRDYYVCTDPNSDPDHVFLKRSWGSNYYHKLLLEPLDAEDLSDDELMTALNEAKESALSDSEE